MLSCAVFSAVSLGLIVRTAASMGEVRQLEVVWLYFFIDLCARLKPENRKVFGIKIIQIAF